MGTHHGLSYAQHQQGRLPTAKPLQSCAVASPEKNISSAHVTKPTREGRVPQRIFRQLDHRIDTAARLMYRRHIVRGAARVALQGNKDMRAANKCTTSKLNMSNNIAWT